MGSPAGMILPTTPTTLSGVKATLFSGPAVRAQTRGVGCNVVGQRGRIGLVGSAQADGDGAVGRPVRATEGYVSARRAAVGCKRNAGLGEHLHRVARRSLEAAVGEGDDLERAARGT